MIASRAFVIICWEFKWSKFDINSVYELLLQIPHTTQNMYSHTAQKLLVQFNMYWNGYSYKLIHHLHRAFCQFICVRCNLCKALIAQLHLAI